MVKNIKYKKSKSRKNRKSRQNEFRTYKNLYGGGGQPYIPDEISTIQKTYNNKNLDQTHKNKRLERLLKQAEKDKKERNNQERIQGLPRQRSFISISITIV